MILCFKRKHTNERGDLKYLIAIAHGLRGRWEDRNKCIDKTRTDHRTS